MVPGRRMEAILGFVDIRGFNLVTEVLNEKVTGRAEQNFQQFLTKKLRLEIGAKECIV